ncbi:calcium-binding protein [Roseovarius atlanticus]|uniref:calcium-binding protein n=1 Tax=Roseovarius atlanticus TaxID=1641875 RepID=UPI001C97D279|nr:calcium-binding protein [Roseovarius atlanticus]MBY6127052.1 calcium-binding protein [Roseovarius atlanticus]MBY6151546.1 calcium-binding protein [Roseovarius atlanticus]
MPNWNSIYNGLFSGPIPAGEVTPGTDNVDFDDFPGVNKAKMLGGNDFADGNDGANVIFGNGGNDYLRGDGGDDSLHGGGHSDAIVGDSFTLADLTGGAAAGDDMLWGGWGDDVIAGQNGNDNIDGGNGRDLLMGGNGRDHMNGGMGADLVIGGNGNDTILGGWNDDFLAGQLGNDSMRGGSGDDLMSGGDGEDTMYGGSQNDSMSGNAGHDYMNGGNGHDVMYGNSGDDVMRGWNGNDFMRGDCGDDALAGERGDDLLLGDKGQDYITGGAGDDSIDGGKHDDIIEGNNNADCIMGGEGNDLIWGDNANLADPTTGEASDLISGGAGNDTIHGGEDDDQINGDEDDDEIYGDSGNDTIAGDNGDDSVDGGNGNDHITGGRGADSLDGGIGNDIIDGGRDNDTIDGGNGHDYILGGQGSDDLQGGNGHDTIDGGKQSDIIDGGSGDDLLYGGDDGAAGDLIQGGFGADTLIGGGGGDTLDGGKNDDCLISGTGDETLTGGADGDTFTFGYDLDVNRDGDCDDDEDRTVDTHGKDVITDFSKVNGDLIQLHSALSITNVALAGNDLIITTTGGEIMVRDAALNISGLNPGDPDFDTSSAALTDFITDYDPETGEGKGFVLWDDKCVTIPDRSPDAPETGWEARFPDAVTATRDVSNETIGDTTKNTTEKIMVERFLEGDVNVNLVGNQIFFDPDASTPPTVEVTASDEVIEDIDASAQMISQSGTVSFDDIDSTDTVTITYEVKDVPVWSDGDFADVDPTLPDQLIAAFFTGVEDADKPGTTPWTWEGTFDLDFLAKDETITFVIDVIATDCDDASSRVPLEFLITGTNDAPTVQVLNNGVPNETSFVEASNASEQFLPMTIHLAHDDLDYNDTLDIVINSNNDIAWSDGVLAPGLAAALESDGGLDGAVAFDVTTPGFASGIFPVYANLDFLGEGETITWSYTVTVTDPHGATGTDVANYIITGTNDRPVAYDLFFSLSEDDSSAAVDSGEGNVDPFEPLTAAPLVRAFVVDDDDVNDTHTFEIVGLTEISPGVYQTVDEFGNEYGKLYNNGNGTFTFDPEDDFQHLEQGESREVTFQYRARDDSGVGTSPAGPSESELSELKTVTLTIEGADDDPLVHTDRLEFATNDQSQFGTGNAVIFDPDLPFLGIDTGPHSLNATIFAGLNVSGDAVEGFLNGLEDIVNFFGGLFGANDVDIPSEINIPGVSTSGSLEAKVGLQPYFSFNSGEVDAQVPIEVVFTAPRQVEHGDMFTVESLFTVDGGASFQTMSPNVNFGLDFVFDLDVDFALNIFGTNVQLLNFDTDDLIGDGTQGEPGFNIFDLSGEDLQIDEIPLPLGSTLSLNFPVINTEGSPVNPTANTVLENPEDGTHEDDIAVLNIDVDQILTSLAGLPPLGGGDSAGLGIDIGGEGFNLISFNYAWDLIAVNLEATLKVIQDFTMTIEDLPLVAMLEDGSTIDNIFLGDDIEVTLGPDSTFDVDVHGDADGMLDFNIEVDMGAVLENITSLGFDLDLIIGLLRLTGGVSSDFFGDFEYSLFDGIIPSIDGNSDGFLFGDTIELVEDAILADLFNDEFDVVGWNSDQTTTFDVDVA